MMSSAVTGALVGAVLGLLNFGVLRYVAGTIEKGEGSADQKRSASVIRLAALVELMLLPVVGYVVGPLVFEG